MMRSNTREARQLTSTGVFAWPYKKPTILHQKTWMRAEDSEQSHTAGVNGTAAEATRLRKGISMIVKDCVTDELRHLDNQIADISSTLQGRLPTTLRRAINNSVTSTVKATIHKANGELISKMIIGTTCPEENTVRALQEKVDCLDRVVHGLSKSDSEPNQLDSTVKQKNETISALTKMVNTLMSANAVNEEKLAKLQATVEDQALQVANIPKMMTDITSYNTSLKDIPKPDVQPAVDAKIINAMEAKIHELETALESANTKIDALNSADLGFENRIEQIKDSVEKVTTDQNTLPSNDRVERIETTLFDMTGIPTKVKVLEDRIGAQEALPRAPPSLATTLRVIESNVEDLEARMNNCENGVTEGRQSYHRCLDTIDGVKRTVQQSADDLDGVGTQIEDMRKHIDAIDDDLVKDDKRTQVLKNVVETLDQKVKEDSEDLTKLYRRVGACEDAYWRLAGEEDPQQRHSSPLAPIEESSSEGHHDSTMGSQGSSDNDTASSSDQSHMDGEAGHTDIAEDLTDHDAGRAGAEGQGDEENGVE